MRELPGDHADDGSQKRQEDQGDPLPAPGALLGHPVAPLNFRIRLLDLLPGVWGDHGQGLSIEAANLNTIIVCLH
jgi:hypothetical protein